MLTPCRAPWNSLTIASSGEIFFDSIIASSIGNIRTHSITEILQSSKSQMLREQWRQRQWPDDCFACKKKEDISGHSRRLFFDDVLADDSERKNENLRVLEFNTSNICNLKCRMCNSDISSKWISDDIALNLLRPEYHRPSSSAIKSLALSDIDKIFENNKLFSDLKFVALRGGEPFFEHKNAYILKKLIELNLHEKVVLDISTNTCNPGAHFLNAIQQFKSVRLHVSIEGVDSLYSYIRGGNDYSFSEFEDNVFLFQQMKNVSIFFSVTIMAYNITRLPEIFKWYLLNRKLNNEIFFKNVVVRPEYLNYEVLPDEVLHLALSNLRALNPPTGDFSVGDYCQTDMGFQQLMKKLDSPRVMNIEARKMRQKQFLAFTRDLDFLRDQNILDVLPELNDLFAKENTDVELTSR